MIVSSGNPDLHSEGVGFEFLVDKDYSKRIYNFFLYFVRSSTWTVALTRACRVFPPLFPIKYSAAIPLFVFPQF